MILVGLTGKAGSGKSTAAQFLDACGFYEFTLAYPLKNACQHIFNLTSDQLYDQEQKEIIDPRWGFSPRELLQIVGTDLFRNHFGHDIWIDNLHQRITTALDVDDENVKVVISDLRFSNEVDWVLEQGGYVLHLVRDTTTARGSAAAHKSEMYVPPTTGGNVITIENNGTIDQLQNQIESFVLNTLKGK